MTLVDTHCHLHLLDDPETAIREAKEVGVNHIISPSLAVSSCQENITLAKKHSVVLAAVGIHPREFESELVSIEKQLQLIETLLKKEKNHIVAIGEVGLDFAPPPPGQKARLKKEQIFLFKEQVKLAVKYHLPLMIHNRKANRELISLLKPPTLGHKLKAVFHCFSGSKKFLKEVVDLGFYISFGGLVTHDQGLAQVVKEAPEENLLLETDSPFLTPKSIPEEKRWPNQPKNVKIIAQKIAEIKGDSFISIAEQTTNNAQCLFGLSK